MSIRNVVGILLSAVTSAAVGQTVPTAPPCSWPFVQSATPLADVDKVILGEKPNLVDSGYRVYVGWPGFDPKTMAWDVNAKKGLNVKRGYGASKGSLSPGHPNAAGHTAVKLSATTSEVSMRINTATNHPPLKRVNAQGISRDAHNVSINTGCWFGASAPQVFPANGHGLKVSFDFKIPTVYVTPTRETAAFAGAFLLFTHADYPTNKRAFFLSALVFDKRRVGTLPSQFRVPDSTETTNVDAILGSKIDVPGWFHRGPRSAGFSTERSPYWKSYEIRISPAEFERAIRSAYLLPETPPESEPSDKSVLRPAANWRLLNVTIGPEVADGDAGGGRAFASIGVTTRKLRIEPYYASTTSPFEQQLPSQP